MMYLSIRLGDRLPLESGAYLHVSSEGKEDRVVITGGLPDAGLDGENVLLLV
jgi:hypothetical protein